MDDRAPPHQVKSEGDDLRRRLDTEAEERRLTALLANQRATRAADTVLIDQETVYAPRYGNDRLLLGLKGSLNEYELDLLRQRSLSARTEKARRGELVVSAPVGFVKAGDRYEKKTRTAGCKKDSDWCSTRCWSSAARGRRCSGSLSMILTCR